MSSHHYRRRLFFSIVSVKKQSKNFPITIWYQDVISQLHHNRTAIKTWNDLFAGISSRLTVRTIAAAMAQKLQFFKLIRELYQKIGMHPCRSNESGSYNVRNSFIFIHLAQTFIESVAFLLFEANSIEEYGQSFYASVTLLLLLCLWPSFIHNMDNLFNLMDQMDEFGQKSE